MIETILLCALSADPAIWLEPGEDCETWEIHGQTDVTTLGASVILPTEMTDLIVDCTAESPWDGVGCWLTDLSGPCDGLTRFGVLLEPPAEPDVFSGLIATLEFSEPVDLVIVGGECLTTWWDGEIPNWPIETAVAPNGPCNCKWDLDFSGDVGVTDFLALLSYWGEPFDVVDQLALLAAWGGVPGERRVRPVVRPRLAAVEPEFRLLPGLAVERAVHPDRRGRVMKPRALDLFCGAGGATKGLQRAGFHVTGVDINPQPNYCGDEFVQADAMEYPMNGYDLVWASPPCQGYSHAVRGDRSKAPRLIQKVRTRLAESGTSYVIENVVGAASELRGPVLLCGSMFGLHTPRHRLFECRPWMLTLPHVHCRGMAVKAAAVNGWDARDMSVTGKGRRVGCSERWAQILGIDWRMTQAELAEAIPPAYSEWIGRQLLENGMTKR